ncbi:MAG: polyprenyl synthetase family protein [Bacteroidaceae bacterium]|nr:polyprenyl synthetase family protein [Bacteroidaceae bacterium]
MYSVAELTEKVTAALEQLPYDRQPQGLYAPIKYVLSLGGKRIRPVLMLMAYNMYREDVDRIMPVALGLEVYHNFTLLHDDLMDRADVRRGKPCVHKVWNDNTAILSGDNMLVMAYQMMSRCPSSALPSVISIFTETALQIDEGQQYDMEFEQRTDVTEREYLEMIRLKTSVLLACALQIGALLGGASEADAQALYAYGEKVGLAFQLQDDYLDVYGDFETFGKAIGGDILCNKKTFMLINALAHAPEHLRTELQGWLAATEYDPAEKIESVRHIYTQVGVDQMAKEQFSFYIAQAEDALRALPIAEERKEILRQWTEQLLGRKR